MQRLPHSLSLPWRNKNIKYIQCPTKTFAIAAFNFPSGERCRKSSNRRFGSMSRLRRRLDEARGIDTNLSSGKSINLLSGPAGMFSTRTSRSLVLILSFLPPLFLMASSHHKSEGETKCGCKIQNTYFEQGNWICTPYIRNANENS